MGRKSQDQKVRQAAIDWLMQDEDFLRVCEMAGLDSCRRSGELTLARTKLRFPPNIVAE